MKIQYISYERKNINEIECTTIANPMSFDAFDVNIIKLNSKYIWQNNSGNTRSINCFKDLENLKEMSSILKKVKTVI